MLARLGGAPEGVSGWGTGPGRYCALHCQVIRGGGLRVTDAVRPTCCDSLYEDCTAGAGAGDEDGGLKLLEHSMVHPAHQ